MEREEVKARVIEILTSSAFSSLRADPSRLREETSLLNELELDSLQLLDLIVAIENAFGFRANTKTLNIDIFDQFGMLIDFVLRSVSAQGAESVAVE